MILCFAWFSSQSGGKKEKTKLGEKNKQREGEARAKDETGWMRMDKWTGGEKSEKKE